jgi:hypothetical protein
LALGILTTILLTYGVGVFEALTFRAHKNPEEYPESHAHLSQALAFTVLQVVIAPFIVVGLASASCLFN